ncbi:MAG: hypothetical protein HAW59_02255 [Betaproteobacteria bacterium]|nr:hypothetical protein [Betaproteobacteria bacterium]
MNKTAFVFHELYLWHDAGRAALESPAGLWVQPDAHMIYFAIFAGGNFNQ